MSQAIEISDELALDARQIGELAQRSVSTQIEFWAQLGRTIEPVLEGPRVLALQQAGAVAPLSKCLGTVNSPEGRRRLAAYLESLPFPHYEPATGTKGLLVRVDADGTRTTGRFVDGKFQAEK